MRRGIFKALAVLVLLAGFFGGLIVLGQLAQENLRQREHYSTAFLSIDCAPPPGMKREEFLEEVQYYASMPANLVVLDKDLPARLTAGFKKHPWVHAVREVVVTAPKHIVVRLEFRKPVLAIPLRGEWRAVDRQGVLLPRRAVTLDLPVYRGEFDPPRRPEGEPWGDPRIEQAAAREARVK